MFYKEWLLIRQKFFLLVIFYGLAALLVATIFAPNYSNQYPEAPFYTWLSVAQVLTIGAAVLGGGDAFAEETDKGTIGFLLTHPISRTRIYLTKLTMNCSAFVVALFASSLPMILVDRIPRTHAIYDYTFNDCGVVTNNITNEVLNPTTTLPVALTGLGITLLIGLMLLCLSTLVSIYARNTITAIMYTIFAILVLIFGLFFLSNTLMQTTINFATFKGFQLLPYFLPLVIAFFLAGLISFKRKEF